jgi:hypothetical protein
MAYASFSVRYRTQLASMHLPSSDGRSFAARVCSALDQLGVPSAFLNRKLDKFIAWNTPFLKVLTVSEDRIKVMAASEILFFEETGIKVNGGVGMIPCSSRLPGQQQVSGHAIVTQEGITFVMLDVNEPSRQIFESDRRAALPEEQSRLHHFFQHQLSPHLLVTAFLVENLSHQLKAAQPELAKKAEEIGTLLGHVFDEIHRFVPPAEIDANLEVDAQRAQSQAPDA